MSRTYDGQTYYLIIIRTDQKQSQEKEGRWKTDDFHTHINHEKVRGLLLSCLVVNRACALAILSLYTFRFALRTASRTVARQQHPFLVRNFAGSTFIDAKEVTDRIVTVVKNFDKVDPAKVTPAAKFTDDLGLDSLDSVEVVMAIEDEFAIEIPDAEADKILSIEDATEYISGHPMAK
eukprot:scaffold2686_cov267-Chaetoceros_neogracile.AAC.6